MNGYEELKKRNIEFFNNQHDTFLNLLNDIMTLNNKSSMNDILEFKNIQRTALIAPNIEAIIEKHKDAISKYFSKNLNIQALFKNEKKINVPTLIKNMCEEFNLKLNKKTILQKIKNEMVSTVEYSIDLEN